MAEQEEHKNPSVVPFYLFSLRYIPDTPLRGDLMLLINSSQERIDNKAAYDEGANDFGNNNIRFINFP